MVYLNIVKLSTAAPNLVSLSRQGSGDGMLVLLVIIDIHSMFIGMSQLTHLDKRLAQESSVKSKIMRCLYKLLLVEKLSFRNQNPQRSNMRCSYNCPEYAST